MWDECTPAGDRSRLSLRRKLLLFKQLPARTADIRKLKCRPDFGQTPARLHSEFSQIRGLIWTRPELARGGSQRPLGGDRRAVPAHLLRASSRPLQITAPSRIRMMEKSRQEVSGRREGGGETKGAEKPEDCPGPREWDQAENESARLTEDAGAG